MITVFTNGCFEILHPGHVYCLQEARKLGDRLIVGLNSDKSFKKIKGRKPFVPEQDRKYLLETLKYVDEVIIFDEPRPDNLIRRIKPDILVKGSDWVGRLEKEEKILKKFGGTIAIIERKPDYSTTSLIDKVMSQKNPFSEHTAVVYKLLPQYSKIIKIIDIITEAINKKRCIFVCGNGGSAADAQHFATELVTNGVRAFSLSTDTSLITAISNDNSFQELFSTQIKALANPRDIVILLTTSGLSENIVLAAVAAKKQKCTIITLTGEIVDYTIHDNSDIIINVPSSNTQIIQEIHIMILHKIYKAALAQLALRQPDPIT